MQQMLWIILLITIHTSKTLSGELNRYSSTIKCSSDADCYRYSVNSFCYRGANVDSKCRCKPDFIAWSNSTYLICAEHVSGLNSSCVIDEQCELALGVDSQCNEKNICECLPDAHYVDGSCYHSFGYGEVCTTHSDCYVSPETTLHCNYGFCGCGLNEHYTGEKCVPTKHLGEPCLTDESCTLNNTVCRSVCECKVGFVISSDRSACLQVASALYQPCTQLSQCNYVIENSKCSTNGTCVCEDGYHQYGSSKCFRDRNMGQSCTDSRECYTEEIWEELAECKNSFCLCKNGNSYESKCKYAINAATRTYKMDWMGHILAVIIFLTIY